MNDDALRNAFQFEAVNVCTPLAAQAARLYPNDVYLQSEWMRAVSVVRATTNGWHLDRPVQKVQR